MSLLTIVLICIITLLCIVGMYAYLISSATPDPEDKVILDWIEASERAEHTSAEKKVA